MQKHFETAMYGSKAARALLAAEQQHGPIVTVEKRNTVTYSFVGSEHVELMANATYMDGTTVLVPQYAGDTLPRMVEISKMHWDESVDTMFTDESGRDSTGAILTQEDASALV